MLIKSSSHIKMTLNTLYGNKKSEIYKEKAILIGISQIFRNGRMNLKYI